MVFNLTLFPTKDKKKRGGLKKSSQTYQNPLPTFKKIIIKKNLIPKATTLFFYFEISLKLSEIFVF